MFSQRVLSRSFQQHLGRQQPLLTSLDTRACSQALAAVITDVLKKDKEHDALALVTSLLRTCGLELAGVSACGGVFLPSLDNGESESALYALTWAFTSTPEGLWTRRQLQLIAAAGIPLPRDPIIPPTAEMRLRDLFLKYFSGIATAVVSMHDALQRTLQKNEVTMQLKGELTAERSQQTEDSQRVRVHVCWSLHTCRATAFTDSPISLSFIVDV